jgi:DEAD/DEAH box helicase domain-containing protein
MRKITFDIETSGEFKSGLVDPSALDLAVVAIHDSETNEFSSYLQEDLPKLWPIFEKADIIIGYNSDHFDIPILNKYYAGDLTTIRSVDLLKEIKNSLGRRLKLDSIAEATLGRKKIGSGLESIQWWKDGLVEKVCEYCIEDVRITRDIYNYAIKNGSLKYKDFDGIREIKLNTSKWERVEEAPALTHTLPF